MAEAPGSRTGQHTPPAPPVTQVPLPAQAVPKVAPSVDIYHALKDRIEQTRLLTRDLPSSEALANLLGHLTNAYNQVTVIQMTNAAALEHVEEEG